MVMGRRDLSQTVTSLTTYYGLGILDNPQAFSLLVSSAFILSAVVLPIVLKAEYNFELILYITIFF